jgi:2-aminobenzoylacetyl-CoA thioesterase
MRRRTAGQVQERLWYLGREESGIYLLEGEKRSLIVSAGMSYLAPIVARQIQTFGIDERRIEKLLILHSHFDHVGLVPFFTRRYPGLEVYASGRAWEVLRTPRAIETINAFSVGVAEKMGFGGCVSEEDMRWRTDLTGTAISEGAVIDLGGMTVEILLTPGHSSCSVAAYVPELRALFPSDAGGIPYRDEIIPSGNSNFTQYQQSLEKLKRLKCDLLCADHYGYVTGQEAAEYIERSIAAARERRSEIETMLRRTGSLDETVKELVAETFRRNPDYLLTPEIAAGIYRQTVRHLAGAMDPKG